MSRDAKVPKIYETGDDSLPSSRLRPILSETLTEVIPLEKVYVGKLREKRNTSKAIQLISSAFPGFGHLKRCRGFRLLLSPCNVSAQELKASLSAGGFDLSLIEEEFEVLEIPSKPAKTKKQAEACGAIWPVNFHPDPTTESIISGSLFNDEQLTRMETLMRLTAKAARIESVGNSECNGSALIVDPETGEPLALAASKLDQHPLWHAAMIAIDLVAKIQGGGAWDLVDNIDQSSSPSPSSFCSSETSKRKLDGVLPAPLCYPASLHEINFPESKPFESRVKSRPKNKTEDDLHDDNNARTGPYLCTNLWIFLLQEPCAMCAMALLHSRASRIFYGVTTSSGVLGTKAMLHTTPGLNHRYQVWCGLLENECQAVREEVKIREIKLC